MASANIGDIVATTLYKRSKVLADNVLNHNALLAYLQRKGNIRPAGGGRQIIEEIMYPGNSTGGWYAGYDVLDTTPSEVIDAAKMAA